MLQLEGRRTGKSHQWYESLFSSFLFPKSYVNTTSFLSSSSLCIHEGAKSFREVLDELTDVTIGFPLLQEEEEAESGRLWSVFHVSHMNIKLFGNFHWGKQQVAKLKQWKMADFQHGWGVFTLCHCSQPLLCQEGLQRAQLSIQPERWQAKNILLHAPMEHPASIYLSPNPTWPVYKALSESRKHTLLKITLV